MISKYSQHTDVDRIGVYKRFTKVKNYLTKLNNDLNRDDQRVSKQDLERYISEGKYNYTRKFSQSAAIFDAYNAAQQLQSLSGRPRAIFMALHHEYEWQIQWKKAICYAYWADRIFLSLTLTRFNRNKQDISFELTTTNSLRRSGILLGQLISLGWLKSADTHAKLMTKLIDIKGFYDIDDYSHRRTQHFVLRLVGSWQGWPERNEPACAYDEPLFNALIEHWRTTDLELIQHLLLVACDRHTHQARPDNSTVHYDLSLPNLQYDPFEILSVLRLRETLGLPNPELDHPLMNTPLGKLPEPSEPYMDELLEGVLARACDELPELCEGTGITPKTTEPEKPTSLFGKLFGKK